MRDICRIALAVIWEPDPRDRLVPFPSELMKMWPLSMRVNKPANDDASILEPVEIDDPSTLL